MTRNLVYWMIFQILVGIWLFISPFVLDFTDVTTAATNCMVFGAVVFFVGAGIAFFSESACESGIESAVRKSS